MLITDMGKDAHLWSVIIKGTENLIVTDSSGVDSVYSKLSKGQKNNIDKIEYIDEVVT